MLVTSAHAPLPTDIGATLDGLAILQKIITGQLPEPPMGGSTNMKFVEAKHGCVVLSAIAGESHRNMFGAAHGGWISTVLDTALGCSVLASLAAGESFTTIEFKINFLKALPVSGQPLRCVGRLIRRGGSIAVSEADLLDCKGESIAHGVGTCMILKITRDSERP